MFPSLFQVDSFSQQSLHSRTFPRYAEVVVASELISYYDVSGCYILRPSAFAMWEVRAGAVIVMPSGSHAIHYPCDGNWVMLTLVSIVYCYGLCASEEQEFLQLSKELCIQAVSGNK